MAWATWLHSTFSRFHFNAFKIVWVEVKEELSYSAVCGQGERNLLFLRDLAKQVKQVPFAPSSVSEIKYFHRLLLIKTQA